MRRAVFSFIAILSASAFLTTSNLCLANSVFTVKALSACHMAKASVGTQSQTGGTCHKTEPKSPSQKLLCCHDFSASEISSFVLANPSAHFDYQSFTSKNFYQLLNSTNTNSKQSYFLTKEKPDQFFSAFVLASTYSFHAPPSF